MFQRQLADPKEHVSFISGPQTLLSGFFKHFTLSYMRNSPKLRRLKQVWYIALKKLKKRVGQLQKQIDIAFIICSYLSFLHRKKSRTRLHGTFNKSIIFCASRL